MALSKLLACTLCAAVAVSAAGCADGTGKALTPTLPAPDATSSSSGLKATTPQPASPRGSARVSSLTPTLTLTNASATYDSTASLTYVFQVIEAGNVIHESQTIAAGDPSTTFQVPEDVLAMNKTYYWRARASYAGVAGPWSDVAQFRTPVPPPVGNPEGGPVTCATNTGPAIIACVAAAYPAKLVAKISVEARKANMEFIRDRIIETGICKGHDWGRNFKRGTPVLSHDYLVERRPGEKDRGVDLASGYDDPSTPLKLTWQVKGPPDYGFPYYAKYPAFDCGGVN